MVWQWSKSWFTRSWRVITLCCVLLSLTPTNGAPNRAPINATSVTAATVSPHPTSPADIDAKRPNPVKRFFSWVIKGVTRPFRKRDYAGCRLPPIVTIQASSSSIIRPCSGTKITPSPGCPGGSELTLAANATDPGEGEQLLFTWYVTAGRLRGEGRKVTWDLSGVPLGTYTATVEVDDGHQHKAASSTTVAVSSCKDCEAPPAVCAALSVSRPSGLEAGKP